MSEMEGRGGSTETEDSGMTGEAAEADARADTGATEVLRVETGLARGSGWSGWKETLPRTQSINRLYQVSQLYSRTTEQDKSSLVTKKSIVIDVPQSNVIGSCTDLVI